MSFDLSDLTEEALCELLEAVQTALRQRQSVYLRECSVEPHEFVERSSLVGQSVMSLRKGRESDTL